MVCSSDPQAAPASSAPGEISMWAVGEDAPGRALTPQQSPTRLGVAPATGPFPSSFSCSCGGKRYMARRQIVLLKPELSVPVGVASAGVRCAAEWSAGGGAGRTRLWADPGTVPRNSTATVPVVHPCRGATAELSTAFRAGRPVLWITRTAQRTASGWRCGAPDADAAPERPDSEPFGTTAAPGREAPRGRIHAIPRHPHPPGRFLVREDEIPLPRPSSALRGERDQGLMKLIPVRANVQTCSPTCKQP
ncbi:hypothetical protein SAMN05414137_103514 [Streptacidiphilus jiangxiensis]|uniref:Uncharacterized protein n=1 Tax=Streptacidiphilus jiangxiensis TaxID=235985 RepID=A0A1H7JXI7_STRJI|nr:hypothetical protein SAMN05414137_103514 [Streptacidiphilus jiangxiensis]